MLPSVLIQHSIERELFIGLSWQCQHQVRIVDTLHNCLIVALKLMWLHRSASDSYFDSLACATSYHRAIRATSTVMTFIRCLASIYKCSLIPRAPCSLVIALTPWFPHISPTTLRLRRCMTCHIGWILGSLIPVRRCLSTGFHSYLQIYLISWIWINIKIYRK